jgi:hypothetical protein
MLAFSDEALARLAVAATRVAPQRRSAWLQDLAGRLEPEGRRARGRAYTRKWRQRARDGQVLLRVVTDEVGLAVAAVTHGLLDPLRADDRAALAAAAGKVLDAFCTGDISLREPEIYDKVRAKLLDARMKLDDDGGLQSKTRARAETVAGSRASQSRK